MSVQILDAIDGIITLEITGKISPGELAACQAQVLRYLREWGGGSILSISEQGQGWEDGDWTDLSFQEEADPLIRKMAIIGDPKSEHLALAFTAKGYRPFPIEFFPIGHMVEAHAWLKS
jgi:hypothetical protein